MRSRAVSSAAKNFASSGTTMLVLTREVDGVVLVAGSAQLVRTLIDNDLVDELRLMVFPVVLGAGERLFAETAAPKSLRLVDSNPANNCLILTYEAAASQD